jgi:hypothetical protein
MNNASSRTGFSLSVFVMQSNKQYDRFKSPRAKLDLRRFCSARLQAGTFNSSTCSPEGERCKIRPRPATQTLKPLPLQATKIACEKMVAVFLAQENFGPTGGAH